MTVRDVDVEYPFDDPDDGWFGQAIVVEDEPRENEAPDESSPDTAPIPVIVDHHDVATPQVDDDYDVATPGDPDPDPDLDTHDSDTRDLDTHDFDTHDFDTHELVIDESADTDAWYVPAAAPEVDDVPTREEAVPTREVVNPPPPDPWETPATNDVAWDFTSVTSSTSRRGPRYAVVAAACVAAAGAVAGVVLLARSPGPAVDGSTTAAPSESAQPAPRSTAPVLSAQAPIPAPTFPPDLPPDPPPPPPAPAAEEISPGSVTRQYSPPSYQTPDAPQKPQMDVTRAPLSATPPPPPKPDRNSSTPGDSPKRRGFFR